MADEDTGIVARAEAIQQRYQMGALSLQQAANEYMKFVPGVLAEMERLREENVAIREILKILATYSTTNGTPPASAITQMRAFFADSDE